MPNILSESNPAHVGLLFSALCVTALLNACGGGSVVDSGLSVEPISVPSAAPLATGTTTLQMEVAMLPMEALVQMVQPAFHMAPALLTAPDDADSTVEPVSARRSPRRQLLAQDAAGIASRQLTPQLLAQTQAERQHSRRLRELSAPLGVIAPLATSSAFVTYTPAQIRAAYGLPVVPTLSTATTSGTGLSAAQAAQLGAGQTIYIVNANHNPNVAAELAAFNQKFGLPTCTTQVIAPTLALPLAAAPVSGCQLSIVYNTAAGGMTSIAPAYDAGWATEIALDVQWAHATAPLARLVLIEAPDASMNNLLGAIKLANAMGPGAVSMSFGTLEGTWTASVDSVFATANMTYLAATGDSGAAVLWPAVSTKVVAVGGTSLSYAGSGTRSETAWSGTGGGTSLYTLKPSYQSSLVPGMPTTGGRAVADVAFNADPGTGQYVAVMAPGNTAVSWISAGGTSLATPQWAGLIAIANASRALSAKTALGAPHAALYGQIAAIPGTYASAFADITQGTNGTCASCLSRSGYDTPSGLGTPNVGNLLNALSEVVNTVSAPLVTSASISGQVGTALTFTASVMASNALTYALSGAPSGMSISSVGIVSWPTPVAGTYSITVTAKDAVTGLSGQGVYGVTISTPPAKTSTAKVSGKVGAALSFSAAVPSVNAITYTLTGTPAGLTISTAGMVSWPVPVIGTYAVTVTAIDSKTGLSSQVIYTVTIANSGPVITALATTGVAGKALSGAITITDPGATWLSVSIAGAPLGMAFSSTGLTISYAWASPVVGSYSLKVSVIDSAGLTAQATVPVTVKAK